MFGDMNAVVTELAKVKDALNENTKAIKEMHAAMIALTVTMKGVWQQAKSHLEH